MGFLNVGVWGLSCVRGVIHWGKGSVLSSSTTKPYGEEQQESALNPFLGPLLQGYMQKPELFAHITRPTSFFAFPICSVCHIPALPSLLLLATLMCHCCRGLSPLSYKTSPLLFVMLSPGSFILVKSKRTIYSHTETK